MPGCELVYMVLKMFHPGRVFYSFMHFLTVWIDGYWSPVGLSFFFFYI